MNELDYGVKASVWSLCVLLIAQGARAESSIFTNRFNATNHAGVVFEQARISSISTNHVLVTTANGSESGLIYFTNLPPGIRAELAGMLASQRLGLQQRQTYPKGKLYESWTAGLSGKSDLEKAQAFTGIIEKCVAEIKKLTSQMSLAESNSQRSLGIAEAKIAESEAAAKAERESEIKGAKGAFEGGRFSANELSERLAEIEKKSSTQSEQRNKELTREKLRITSTLLQENKDQRERLQELMDVLKRVQDEQAAILGRLSNGTPAK